MKPNNLLAAIAASTLLLFSACNSGGKTEPGAQDTTVSKKDTVTAAPENTLIIMHKVANYAKWKPAYESHDSIRRSYGLANFVIGRGVEDSNMVLVALKMSDAAKAKEMTASAELKSRMQKAGVVGVPTFSYFKVVSLDTATNSLTTRVIMTHKVKDWDAWKKEFDSHKQARTDAGLVDRAVGYSVDDNHLVTVVCAISDMAKAKAFFKSADLKEKMTKAGVEGEPTSFFYNVVEKY